MKLTAERNVGIIPNFQTTVHGNKEHILNLDGAGVLILFVGIGNYPDFCQTTLSKRHKPRFMVFE